MRGRSSFSRVVSALVGAALLLNATACSMFGDEEPTAEDAAGDSPWYNRSFLRSVFGDFEKTPVVAFLDSPKNRELTARGEYLTRSAAACGSCHGAKPGDAESPLSGGRPMQDRFGKVLAANITPDRESGIGEWNPLEIMRAIRGSIDREGRPLSIDLHESYRWMSDQDAKAIALYLRTLKPIKNALPRRRLGGFERNKWGLFPQHREVAGYVPELPVMVSAERGRYLSEHVAQCASCHSGAGTPFSGYGGKGGIVALFRSVIALVTPEQEAYDEQVAQYLSPEGQREYALEMARKQAEREGRAFDGKVPDEKREIADLYEGALTEGRFPVAGPDIRFTSGLSKWNEADLVRYLSSGTAPAGEVRERRFCPWPFYAKMTDGDKASIAKYLATL